MALVPSVTWNGLSNVSSTPMPVFSPMVVTAPYTPTWDAVAISPLAQTNNYAPSQILGWGQPSSAFYNNQYNNYIGGWPQTPPFYGTPDPFQQYWRPPTYPGEPGYIPGWNPVQPPSNTQPPRPVNPPPMQGQPSQVRVTAYAYWNGSQNVPVRSIYIYEYNNYRNRTWNSFYGNWPYQQLTMTNARTGRWYRVLTTWEDGTTRRDDVYVRTPNGIDHTVYRP